MKDKLVKVWISRDLHDNEEWLWPDKPEAMEGSFAYHKHGDFEGVVLNGTVGLKEGTMAQFELRRVKGKR